MAGPFSEHTDAELFAIVQRLYQRYDWPWDFQVVTGDSLQRLSPGERLNVNTTVSWIVGPSERSRYSATIRLTDLSNALEALGEIASRYHKALARLGELPAKTDNRTE